MTFYIIISTCHVRDEIKRLDRMKEHSDILAIYENNTPIKKKTTSRLVYLIVL